MQFLPDEGDWSGFLGNPRRKPAPLKLKNQDSTVLVTGAGGFIGSALVRTLASHAVQKLVLLDCSERNLWEVSRAFPFRHRSVVPILGNVADGSLLDEIFRIHKPEIVFHTAAFKHVPLMEFYPLAAVANNALATYTLAKTAVRHEAAKVIMISTDKAADPASVMGASKRVAELALETLSQALTLMFSVRLGNVLGSPGSVVPLFLEQIARAGPVTVTDPAATRYFITLGRCIEIILQAASHEAGPCVLIPRLGRPHRIVNLANYLMGKARPRRDEKVQIVYTGLRPGEKLAERLVSSRETRRACSDCGLSAVRGPSLKPERIRALMRRLDRCVRERDVPGAVRELHCHVAGYTASAALLSAALARQGTEE